MTCHDDGRKVAVCLAVRRTQQPASGVTLLARKSPWRLTPQNEILYTGEDACDGEQQRADTSERIGPLSFLANLVTAGGAILAVLKPSYELAERRRIRTDLERMKTTGISCRPCQMREAASKCDCL